MENITNLALLRLLHRCSHKIQMAKKYPGQGWLMILLREHGTLTQRELIEITGRRSATLSEQLDSMDKAGLIIREKNEEDRRNIDVTLTPLGKETAKDAEEARQQLADKLMSTLNEAEKEQLNKLLNKVLNAFES
jgi:DNA-binding MarR family transcriptional regulator